MQFMQIIEITTDQVDELVQLEDQWRIAGRGRRTGTADWLCTDRATPGRYFSVNLFPSHEAAVANSELPETGAMAGRAMQLGSATFHDCDVLHDLWADELDTVAARFAAVLATGSVTDELFADDAVAEFSLPHRYEQLVGVEEIRSTVAVSFGDGNVEEQRILPSIRGFVLEVTLTTPTGRSRAVGVARVVGGLIAHLAVYSTGELT